MLGHISLDTMAARRRIVIKIVRKYVIYDMIVAGILCDRLYEDLNETQICST